MSDRAPFSGRGPWGFIQAFVLGGALVALWRMPQWLWTGEARIEGAKRIDPQYARRVALGDRGLPLFRIDPRLIRARLMELEAVEDVKVRRWLFPARVEIVLQERVPVVRVEGKASPTYLDSAGKAFTLPPGAKPEKAIALGVHLASASLAPADRTALRRLLDTWPKGSVGVVDMRDPASWSARIDGIRVLLGTSEALDEKFRVFEHLIPLARQGGKRLEYIDLRFPEAPTIRALEATR